jgi:GTPase SAR1 family protein
VLESHTDTITGLKFSQEGALLASHAKDGHMFLWRCDSWERIASQKLPARNINTSTLIAFHPHMPLMALPASDGASVDLWEMDHRGLIYPVQDGDSIQYTTARVALVGDSGVGKSALGFRMVHGHFAETTPTHGQEFWTLKNFSTADSKGSQHEVVLWDFAGQNDYRLIHTLFMEDIDIALILFDGSEFDEPMRGVEYWLRQLESAGRPVKKILVGGRLDKGEPPMTDKDLEAYCRYHGIDGGYVGTSALTGKGIPELLERIQQQIDWNQMAPTVTSTTFRRIKTFLLELKADPLWERVLITPEELSTFLKALDASWTFTHDELMTAARHLENHGYVTLLDDADLEPTILLAPELLIQLASSFILRARQHPRGLGALEEDGLLQGTVDLPELAGLPHKDQEVLREAATLLLLKNHLCFREKSEDHTLLIFPALINRKHPHLKHVKVRDDVSYRVSGAVNNVYASLVVQLSYTTRFTSAHRWQNQAQFQMGVGEICGFRLEEVEDGEVDLVLYYGADVQDYTRSIFQSLFEKFLKASKVDFTCYQPITCPGCRHLQDRSVVARRIQNQSNFLHCVECGNFIDLISPPEQALIEAETKGALQQEQHQSQMRTAFELTLVKLKGMVQDRAPSCFISYAWGNDTHREWVRRLAHYLEQAGIEVIWDQAQEPIYGHTLSRFIEQIEKVDIIIAVGTPLYREKYECETGSVVAAEAELINLRLMASEVEKQSVLPILLEGNSKSALPPLMQARVFADFRQERFYFLSMFKLIYTLYGFSPVHPVIDKLQSFMHRSAEQKS